MNRHPLWVVDLAHYKPKIEGHWPAYCAGFNLSKSGRVWLCDNQDVIIDTPKAKGRTYPCHRDLIDGSGEDETFHSGLYCWKDGPSLWLYPHTEMHFNQSMLNGLKSLIGVHLITASTKVLSNTWRHTIASLDSDFINTRDDR